MARKAVETKDSDAVYNNEKSVSQMASEAMDAEEQHEKKKRIRRSKSTIIIDRINKLYRGRTELDVFEKELAKIESALEAMENAKTKKKKISEEDVLSQFTVEQLQEMIAKKKAN